MKYVSTLALLTVLAFDCYSSFFQMDYSTDNIRRLDSVKRYFLPACKTLSSSGSVAKTGVDYDKKLLLLINDFYLRSLTKKEILNRIKRHNKRKFAVDSTNLGGAILYKIGLPAKGNLSVVLSFTIFDDEIVYKSISFHTSTKTNCLAPKFDSLIPEDLNYLETVCIPNLEIPLNLCWSCEYITSDTTNHQALKNYDGSKYILLKSDTLQYINRVTWHDIRVYNNESPATELAFLIKNRNISLLEQLLFSPNYVLSVYSMEALIFLEDSETEPLPNNIHEKMNEIINSRTPIYYQYSDVIRPDIFYKDLNVSKRQILAKYKRL